MNVLASFQADSAATFSTLKVAHELIMQGDMAYFSLVSESQADVYLVLAVGANYKADSFEWNHTSDPQNAFEINFDSLCVDSNSCPIVEDISGISAVQGQPVQLTNTQILSLNEKLKEHFEDEEIRKLKEAA